MTNTKEVKPKDLDVCSTLGEVIECMEKSKIENIDLEFDVSITFYHAKSFSLDELKESVKAPSQSYLLDKDMESWVEINNDIYDLSKTENDIENYSLQSVGLSK